VFLAARDNDVCSSLFASSIQFIGQSFAVNNFSKNEFLSFYINAYNILAAKVIVNHQCEGIAGDTSRIQLTSVQTISSAPAGFCQRLGLLRHS
jgi:hypothetical protein